MQPTAKNIAILRASIAGEPQYLWCQADKLTDKQIDETPLFKLPQNFSFSSKFFQNLSTYADSKPIILFGNVKANNSILNPLPNPGKTICTALNYPSHIRELSKALPRTPSFFSKYAGALTDPFAPIHLPTNEMLLDSEVELGVIVGDHTTWRTRLTPSDVEKSIFGYVLVNDVTSRRLLVDDEGTLWRGKNLPKSTPVGPWIIPTETMRNLTDFVEPGTPKLNLKSSISRRGISQSGSTNEMLFSIAEIFNKILEATSLDPGDLIFTGTPGGTGLRISKLEMLVGQLTNYKFKNIFLNKQTKSDRYLIIGDKITIEGDFIGSQCCKIQGGTS